MNSIANDNGTYLRLMLSSNVNTIHIAKPTYDLILQDDGPMHSNIEINLNVFRVSYIHSDYSKTLQNVNLRQSAAEIRTIRFLNEKLEILAVANDSDTALANMNILKIDQVGSKTKHPWTTDKQYIVLSRDKKRMKRIFTVFPTTENRIEGKILRKINIQKAVS